MAYRSAPRQTRCGTARTPKADWRARAVPRVPGLVRGPKRAKPPPGRGAPSGGPAGWSVTLTREGP